MKTTSIHATAIAGLVVAASVVGLVGVAVPALGTTAPALDAASALGTTDAKAIDACQTIDDSGRYELETNLTDAADSAEACLEIESDDVTIDGNGYRVSMAEADDEFRTPYAVRGVGVENVTVTNLTAVGWGDSVAEVGTAVRFADASDVSVTNVTVGPYSWNGIAVRNGSDVTVRDVDMTGVEHIAVVAPSGSAIRLANVEDAVVRGGAIRKWETGVEVTDSANVTVAAMAIGGEGTLSGPSSPAVIPEYSTYDAVRVTTTTNATVRDSTVSYADQGVILGHGASGVVVADSDFSRNPQAIVVRTTGTDLDANVVRNNTISENDYGVWVGATTTPLRIVGNRFTDNALAGVEIAASETCGPGPDSSELVSVHGNTFGNDTTVHRSAFHARL